MDERKAWTPHPWVEACRDEVRFGVGASSIVPEVDGAARLRFARAVDESGLDSLWVPDHPTVTTDCWTTLAAYAAVTSRVRLGPLVNCVFYRSPFQLARQAADVDRLSGGRLVLGLGTGSYEPEFAKIGIPVPSRADRRRALDEAMNSLPILWGDDPFRPNFAAWSMDGSSLRSQPVQHPRVPLLIAGDGERVTLRRVAEAADMCNLDYRGKWTPEDVHHKLEVLRAHCDSVGRPYDSILRSVLLNRIMLAPTEEAATRKAQATTMMKFTGTPRQFIAYCEPLIQAGAQYVIVNLASYDDLETVELLATQVVPELQGLAV
jgi:alkanesulfonate monooxygenase SsuD/methylene tetrahydromethanopterin reductase-like flavin-dependent oxidoreductase (luciferase family)